MGGPWVVLGACALLVLYLGTGSRRTDAPQTVTSGGWQVVDDGSGVLKVLSPAGQLAVSFRKETGVVLEHHLTIPPADLAQIMTAWGLLPAGNT